MTPPPSASDPQVRVTAILVADAVGSTAAAREDQAMAISDLRRAKRLLREMVGASGGDAARDLGDGVIALFDSVADALSCALLFQQRDRRRYRTGFRIGLHVGDVFAVDGEIYGDALNVAARVEAQSEEGGVCISRAVYDLGAHHVDASFTSLGPQALKGVDGLVELFRVERPAAEAVAVSPGPQAAPIEALRSTRAPAPGADNDGPPSIAVMPLSVVSDDQSGPLLGHGLTYDVISRLTRFRRLDVIAHASTWAVRDAALGPRELGARLDARFLINGALQLSRGVMRLSIELIETHSERLLWAETYQRPLDELFAVQAEIAELSVAAMVVEVEQAERRRVMARDPASLDAYRLCLRGMDELLPLEPAGCDAALGMFARAASQDPAYARPVALQAFAYGLQWKYHWCDQKDAVIEEARGCAARAIDLDVNDARGHAQHGWLLLYTREHERSLAAYREAMALNPSDADIIAGYADALKHYGAPADSVPLFERAIRLNPHSADHYLKDQAHAHFVQGDYETAVQTVHRMRRPQLCDRVMAASCAMLGRDAAAAAAARRLRSRFPDFVAERWIEVVPDRLESHSATLLEGLQKAGL